MSSVSTSLRNAFLDLLDSDTRDQAACDLAAQLLECTDALPLEYCEIVDLEPGCTFADAARALRESLAC